MYEDNDQWLELDFDYKVPWDEVDTSDKLEPFIGLKRGRGVGKHEYPEKLDIDVNELSQLIDELEGRINILFKLMPKVDDSHEINKNRRAKERTSMTPKNEFKKELETIDKALSDEGVETGYSCCLNTHFYLGFEKLRNGLSMPVTVKNDIQGVENITYNPFGELDITHFNNETVIIEDSFMSMLPENYQNSAIEKKIREAVIEEEYPSKPITMRFDGEKYELTPEDWEERHFPVNEEKTSKIAEILEKEDFQVNRYRLNKAEQPKDFRLIVTEYEEI